MQSAWYLVCALAILKASGTLGGAVSNGVECGGDSGNTCDTTEGLTCIITYDGCGTHGLCGCVAGKVFDTKCKTVVAHDGDCSGSDKVCVTGLACTANKCACGSGTYDANHPSLCLASGEGLFDAPCGDATSGTSGNPTNANCQSGVCAAALTCACTDGYYKDSHGYCHKPYYGQKCVPAHDVCEPTASTECASGATECSCISATPLAFSTISMGCTVDGAKAEGETCSTTDDCKGKDLRCGKCGTSDASKCKKPKSTANNENGVNPTQALSLLSIVFIATSAITLM